MAQVKAKHSVQAVALLALLVVAGCASQSSDTGTTGNPPGSVVTTSDTATAPTSTYVTFQTVQGKWGETITVDGGVDAPLRDPDGKILHAGDKLVYCVVSLRNTGSTPLPYDQADFYLNTPNEAWAGGYGGAATVLEPPLGAGTLEPGGTARGAASFEFTRAEAVDSLWLYFDVSWNRRVTATWR